jgi:glycosyltransferase involved in cell wall biosynthesis
VRVVFLTHNYLGRPGDPSSGSLGALARALSRRGIFVRVVAPSDESGETEVDGVSVSRVRLARSVREWTGSSDRLMSSLRNPLGWLALGRFRSAMRAAARKEVSDGAEILHAHSWLPTGYAAPSGIPLVLTVDGPDGALLPRSRRARTMARPILQGASVLTAVSREVGNWVQATAGRFVDSSCIHPMPADTRGYPWTRGGGGAVVLSSLIPSKRVDLALETVAELVSCGHDFPLTIIGDGTERTSLEQRAARLGIAALVRFVGARTDAEARSYLERADVLLFTDRGEGTAPAAVQALACGVPVVACWDSGAAVEIVPESGPGRLTLPSPEALAQAVLDLQRDPDRLAMGRLVGESWRARLAPAHAAELCEGWYRSALVNRAPT